MTGFKDMLDRYMKKAEDVPKYTVMVVDDDIGQRESLEVSYKRRGFNVILCETGEEALSRIHESIDVVILDVKMPKLKGNEVYRQIKEIKDVPIIFYTAYAGEDMEDCMSLAPADYLQKGTAENYWRLIEATEKLVGR